MKVLQNIASLWQVRENNSPDVQSVLEGIHGSLMSAFEQKWAIHGHNAALCRRLDLAYVVRPIEESSFFEAPMHLKPARPFDCQVTTSEKIAAVILEYDQKKTTLSLHSGLRFPSRRVRLIRDRDKFYLVENGFHVPVSEIPLIVREYAYNVAHPTE